MYLNELIGAQSYCNCGSELVIYLWLNFDCNDVILTKLMVGVFGLTGKLIPNSARVYSDWNGWR